MNTTIINNLKKMEEHAKLLHLDSCNTNNKKKNARGLGSKYLQVEVVEMLFHLGLIFVTTPSSHTF
jgi:hypothetical protein